MKAKWLLVTQHVELKFTLLDPQASGRCTTVSGLIVDEGDQGIWKLLTGDVQQVCGNASVPQTL